MLADGVPPNNRLRSGTRARRPDALANVMQASAWRYGSNSQGPHPEVRQFVVAMVQATEPWFQQQKKLTKRSAG
jgi:hypothetical protein